MLTLIHRARRSTVARTLTAALCACLLSLSASADDPPKDKQFDFETDEVTVDVLKPDASVVEVLTANARKSLIRIRLDFVAEIVRSAEDI